MPTREKDVLPHIEAASEEGSFYIHETVTLPIMPKSNNTNLIKPWICNHKVNTQNTDVLKRRWYLHSDKLTQSFIHVVYKSLTPTGMRFVYELPRLTAFYDSILTEIEPHKWGFIDFNIVWCQPVRIGTG